MRSTAFLLVALSISLPSLAHAQDGADGTPAEPPADYQEAVSLALAESAEERWTEARAAFRHAHEVFPNARTERGIGMVAYELRDYVDCVRHLRRALADQRRALTDEQRTSVQTLLERALDLVGVFSLDDVPAEGQIVVDGTPAEREDDGTLLLSAGPHEVHVSGVERGQSRFRVRGGENRPLPVVLETEPDPTEYPVQDEPAAPTPTPVVVEDTGTPVGGIAMTIGGAVVLVAGIATLIAGVVDLGVVEGAEAGTEWSELSGANDRAPILTGVGFALLGVGAAATLGGTLWLAASGGSTTVETAGRVMLGGSF